MERAPFYKFLLTKEKEMEIQKRGSPSSTPSSQVYALTNRNTEEENFLEKLDLQQNVELQEADDRDRDNDDDHPPQEWQWPIVKALTKSDVGDLCRLVLHKEHVKTFFREWPLSLVRNIAQGEKHHVVIIDIDTDLSEHVLVFHRWMSNGLYVIQSNWCKEFVRRRTLKPGDVIGLRWNTEDNCFIFSVLSRA